MASNISFNPMATTGTSGGFVLSTEGYVQGVFLDDPVARYQLEGGVVSSSQSTPLWGGLPLTVSAPLVGANPLGPSAIAATAYTNINAWCVFNQAAAGIISPSSNVPLYGSGMSVNFMRPGSLARIALPIDPTLVNTLAGASETTAVSWDFTANRIVAFNTTALPVVIEFLSTTSKIVTYNSGTGYATWTDQSAVAVCRI